MQWLQWYDDKETIGAFADPAEKKTRERGGDGMQARIDRSPIQPAWVRDEINYLMYRLRVER